MNTPELSLLGKPTAYIDHYDPDLLYPIARANKRAELGLSTGNFPFMGADIWNAYELSWLNRRGKPQIALARLVVPHDSPNIIESKSMKLYFNSFSQTVFDSELEVLACIKNDMSFALMRPLQELSLSTDSTPAARAVQTQASHTLALGAELIGPERFEMERIADFEGLDLDRLDIECVHYQPRPELLQVTTGLPQVTETLRSNLLKSNCLVTGQPDWGSVQIHYSGDAIDQEGLLGYIVSFRDHNEFHEQCVERIFMDIWTRCRPTRLSVYARYTRRGGLDINPFRTSHPERLPLQVRLARQ
jgi:7-cyano-7-deazaguanine reductase